jgi:hypothetical protein
MKKVKSFIIAIGAFALIGWGACAALVSWLQTLPKWKEVEQHGQGE